MLVACLLAPAASVHAHGTATTRGLGEDELRSVEAQSLGPDHAREHAFERRAERQALTEWRALTPGERDALQEQAAANSQQLAATGPASELGSWTTAPFPIPNFAIHSAVLPTGKVLFWGYPPIADGERPNAGQAALWDPSKGTGPSSLRSVPPPEIDVDGDGDTEAAPIYCSGQSFLPSGELLVTGGNLVWGSVPDDDYTTFAGHNRAFTFDPWSETWTEQPAMRHGRWYPSQVLMADGRTAILSGYDENAPGGLYNRELEIFTPSESIGGVGTMEHAPSGDRQLSTYPHLFTLASGDVGLAGAHRYDSAMLDDEALGWTEFDPASRTRDAGTAVLVPRGPDGSSEVIQIGGYDLGGAQDPDGSRPATATAEGIDFSQDIPSWSPAAPLNLGRSTHNTVQLPDGSMVTVGGGRGYDTELGAYLTHDDGRLRQVELYDPITDSWRLGPAQEEDRAYHSTAVLLPDGRVMSAGDDLHPVPAEGGFSSSDTAEIYSPPYLFGGERPVIGKAPSRVGWGQAFEINSTSPQIERAVLMAPAATTHGVDMSQRLVELEVTGVAAGLGMSVLAPPAPAVAPPGHYMLFLLNAQGVPSVASWVQLAEPEPEAPGTPGQKGPVVGVKLLRTLSSGGSDALLARVRVDSAATVKMKVKVTADGRTLGKRRTTIRFGSGGKRYSRIKLNGAHLAPGRWRAGIAVSAHDEEGNTTVWRRDVVVRR